MDKHKETYHFFQQHFIWFFSSKAKLILLVIIGTNGVIYSTPISEQMKESGRTSKKVKGARVLDAKTEQNLGK